VYAVDVHRWHLGYITRPERERISPVHRPKISPVNAQSLVGRLEFASSSEGLRVGRCRLSRASVQVMQSNLDHFVSSPPAPSPPKISFTSQEIRDRKSAFVAYIIPVKDASQVKDAVAHIRRMHASRPPAHEITAWRFMTLKPGMTGLGGEDDFEVVSAYDDDGEKWAGGKVLNIMRQAGVMDAVVVVSRWWVHPPVCVDQSDPLCRFGGIMLGPARFTHIETCAAEICKHFKLQEDLKDCRTMLSSLDDILADLRSEFTALTGKPSTHKTMDYDSIGDLPRLRKLVVAREAAIKSIKGLIGRAKEQMDRPEGELSV